MRYCPIPRRCHLFCILVIAFLSPPASAAADNWESIGHDPLVVDSEIFLRRDALEDLGEGNYYVITLTVHPVTVRGIDLPTANGETRYETRFPHRSYVNISIYDCPRRKSAVGQTLYFSGTRPKEDELVYKHVEDAPMMLPEMLDDPVYDVVCD